MISLFALSALAAPSDLFDRWQQVAAQVRAVTPVPVPLTADEAAAIVRGEVIASRFDTDDGAYATGAAYVDAPVGAVWLVINDGEHQESSRAKLRVLQASPSFRRVHITLELPFPVSDRQWVSDIVPNPDLFAITDGRVWQRQWTLGDRTLATSPDKAVWLKENRGAWTMVDLGEGTLVLFSVRTVLGGLLPASVTRAWAIRSLRRSLGELEPRAQEMREHYDAAHRRIADPSGREIPCFTD